MPETETKLNNFAPFEIVDKGAACPILIVCDHASNALPNGYGSLGLPPALLQHHIAWDPGAADMARHLASAFKTRAILCGFTRLLIDANRGDSDPTLITAISDGNIIAGNVDLDADERARRQARFHNAYHGAIKAEVDRHLAEDRVPLLLSIHSFSPETHGKVKPWHLGVLWDRDSRLARPLMEHFGRQEHIIAGNNKPYSGAIPGDCMNRHGTGRGLPHVLIEFRQDLISDRSGLETWGHHLYEALSGVLRMSGPFEIL